MLWVDVGNLFRHQGSYTGIQRTLAELLGEWLKAPTPRIRLCRFDPGSRSYLDVPCQQVQDLLEAHRMGWPAPARPSPRGRKQLAWLLGRALFLPLFRRLPYDLHQSIQLVASGAYRLARGIKHSVREVLRKMRRIPDRHAVPSEPRPPLQPVPFGTKDVLLTGGTWDDLGCCETLAWMRQHIGLRLVPLIYDLIPELLPQLSAPGLPELFVPWVRQMVAQADLVLTISDNSRRDLLALAANLGLAVPPVAVVRLGDELDGRQPATRPSELPAWVQSFVLCVGTIEARKNHAVLYHLWRRLTQRNPNDLPPLVWAGRPGWLTKDLLTLTRLDMLTRERVIVLPEVTDQELRWLYQNCRFTVYPSHYEGWGLPVAESLAHGKFCLASHSSSLPEIAPGLIDLIDPMDLPNWVGQLEKTLFVPHYLGERERWIGQGFQPTPWAATARQTLDGLRQHLALGLEEEGLQEREAA
jgi:glycosyltransferase involved in cell wall biosynthesis